MHKAASDFIAQYRNNRPVTVIEIGSRNINGTVRTLFPYAKWIGLDTSPGRDVDIVIDAEKYQPDNLVDIVICCEVFEHTPRWREILAVSKHWLKPGGYFLITCAGPGRTEHSAVDGRALREGEWYQNVSVSELCAEMVKLEIEIVNANKSGFDTRMLARKPVT